MHIDYAGLTFSGINRADIFSRLDEGFYFQIVTVNAEFIVEAQSNQRLRRIINESFSTFDGELPYSRAVKKHPKVKIDKISGSDICYDIFRYAEKKGRKVFILGGSEVSNSACCENVRKRFGVELEGFSPELESYPFSSTNTKRITERIESFRPDILFVCFGAVKQEFWIDDNKDLLTSIGCGMAIGAGGTVDFLSGRIKRAPLLVQKAGLEGIYRFLREPKLFRARRLLKSLKLFMIKNA